jgi:hypothetical protein
MLACASSKANPNRPGFHGFLSVTGFLSIPDFLGVPGFFRFPDSIRFPCLCKGRNSHHFLSESLPPAPILGLLPALGMALFLMALDLTLSLGRVPGLLALVLFRGLALLLTLALIRQKIRQVQRFAPQGTANQAVGESVFFRKPHPFSAILIDFQDSPLDRQGRRFPEMLSR